MKYSISKPDDTNYFPEGVALFGLAVSNWLFVTQFLAVLYLCRFVSLDEMRDVFSVAPTILTIATAFCCKYFSRTKLKLIVLQIVIQWFIFTFLIYFLSVLTVSMSLIISQHGSCIFRFWLFTIPIAILLQFISTGILTSANFTDAKTNSFSENQAAEIQNSGLMSGSKVNFIAYLYKWFEVLAFFSFQNYCYAAYCANFLENNLSHK